MSRHSDPAPMSESERRRRLHAAYQILLETARKKEAAQADAVSDTPAQEQGVVRSVHL